MANELRDGTALKAITLMDGTVIRVCRGGKAKAITVC